MSGAADGVANDEAAVGGAGPDLGDDGSSLDLTGAAILETSSGEHQAAGTPGWPMNRASGRPQHSFLWKVLTVLCHDLDCPFQHDNSGVCPPPIPAPSIQLPNQDAEYVNHIALDIGGSLIKLVYFSHEPSENSTHGGDAAGAGASASYPALGSRPSPSGATGTQGPPARGGA